MIDPPSLVSEPSGQRLSASQWPFTGDRGASCTRRPVGWTQGPLRLGSALVAPSRRPSAHWSLTSKAPPTCARPMGVRVPSRLLRQSVAASIAACARAALASGDVYLYVHMCVTDHGCHQGSKYRTRSARECLAPCACAAQLRWRLHRWRRVRCRSLHASCQARVYASRSGGASGCMSPVVCCARRMGLCTEDGPEAQAAVTAALE